MKRHILSFSVILAVLIAGCAGVNTSQLKTGMSPQEVKAVLGKPTCSYEARVKAGNAMVMDFAKDTTGIPNPLDDYGWIFPPTTHIVRVWFVNDRVKQWQADKFKSLEALQKIEGRPEWKMPPLFSCIDTPMP